MATATMTERETTTLVRYRKEGHLVVFELDRVGRRCQLSGAGVVVPTAGGEEETPDRQCQHGPRDRPVAAERQRRLEDSAKKEREVVWYSTMNRSAASSFSVPRKPAVAVPIPVSNISRS